MDSDKKSIRDNLVKAEPRGNYIKKNGNGNESFAEEAIAVDTAVNEFVVEQQDLFDDVVDDTNSNDDKNVPDVLAAEEKVGSDYFPEARGIAFTQLYSETGAVINITARADSCIKAIDDLASAIQYAKTKYKLDVIPFARPSLSQIDKSAQDTAQKDELSSLEPRYVPIEEEYVESDSLLSKAISPQSGTQAARLEPSHQQQQQQRASFNCVQIGVTPRADGRVKIDFYGNEYKTPVDSYPTLSYVGTPESVVELLSPVGQFEAGLFTKAATYTTSFRVVWEYSSKKNSKGLPYKNIVAIEV